MANATECPECGGPIKDGKCSKCGMAMNREQAIQTIYMKLGEIPGAGIIVAPVTNAAPNQMKHLESGQFLPLGGNPPSIKQITAAAKAGHSNGDAGTVVDELTKAGPGVEADEEDDHQHDDAPGRTGSAKVEQQGRGNQADDAETPTSGNPDLSIKPTGNSNPEGHNQYNGGAGGVNHPAMLTSSKAYVASAEAKSSKEHTAAAEAHEKASKEHVQAQKDILGHAKSIGGFANSPHRDAFVNHGEAAMEHDVKAAEHRESAKDQTERAHTAEMAKVTKEHMAKGLSPGDAMAKGLKAADRAYGAADAHGNRGAGRADNAFGAPKPPPAPKPAPAPKAPPKLGKAAAFGSADAASRIQSAQTPPAAARPAPQPVAPAAAASRYEAAPEPATNEDEGVENAFPPKKNKVVESQDEPAPKEGETPAPAGGAGDAEPTGNSNPEGRNQYTGTAGGKSAEEHEALAKKHNQASEKSFVEREKSGGQTSHPETHMMVAAHHEAAAAALRKGDEKGARESARMASDHAQALPVKRQYGSVHNSLQEQVDNCSGTMMARNDREGASEDAVSASMHHPDVREHAFGALDAAKAKDPAKASKFHIKAAEVHEGAALKARQVQDSQLAGQHDRAAALHRQASSLHAAAVPQPPQGGTVMNGAQAKARLTANCKCDRDKAIVNALSDDMAVALVTNAKAEGSNADVTGGTGSVQAGGEEDATEGKDTEFASKKGKGLEMTPAGAKGGMTGNQATEQWLATNKVPPQIAASIRRGQEADHKERLMHVRRITQNVDDGEKRKVVANKYMQMELEELREMAQLFPVENANPNRISELFAPNYLGAAGFADFPTVNRGSTEEEMLLPLPTMNFKEEANAN